MADYSLRTLDADGEDGWPPCEHCPAEEHAGRACPRLPPAGRAEIALPLGRLVETAACPASYVRTPFVAAMWHYKLLAEMGVLAAAFAPGHVPALMIEGIALLESEKRAMEAERMREIRRRDS